MTPCFVSWLQQLSVAVSQTLTTTRKDLVPNLLLPLLCLFQKWTIAIISQCVIPPSFQSRINTFNAQRTRRRIGLGHLILITVMSHRSCQDWIHWALSVHWRIVWACLSNTTTQRPPKMWIPMTPTDTSIVHKAEILIYYYYPVPPLW